MDSPDGSEQTRYWDVVQTFQSFMLWNQDDAPDSNDCVVKAMDWMNVARCVSGKCLDVRDLLLPGIICQLNSISF